MGNGLLQTVRREIQYALEHPGSVLYEDCMKWKDAPDFEARIIESCTCGRGYVIDEIPYHNFYARITTWLDSVEMFFEKKYGYGVGGHIYNNWFESLKKPRHLWKIQNNCYSVDVYDNLIIDWNNIDTTNWSYIPTDDPTKIPLPGLWASYYSNNF